MSPLRRSSDGYQVPQAVAGRCRGKAGPTYTNAATLCGRPLITLDKSKIFSCSNINAERTAHLLHMRQVFAGHDDRLQIIRDSPSVYFFQDPTMLEVFF